MIVLYTITTFLTAFLLFTVQPMVAKAWLPILGGTPAVWNVCMMSFQTLLLVAYLYAHLLDKLKNGKHKLIFHLILIISISLSSLSNIVNQTTSTTPTEPIIWLFSQLTICVAPAFFLLATTSPLLQSLLAQSKDRYAKNPYMLYVASNTGSLLALLAYPTLIEPRFALSQQIVFWESLLKAAQLLIGASIFFGILNRAVPEYNKAEEKSKTVKSNPLNIDRLLWCFYAAIPSALLLAVTNHITTNIAAIPLLWVIPLALYLITFMIAFSETISIKFSSLSNITPLFFLVLSPFIFLDVKAQPIISIVLHSLLYFILALLIHSRLFESRPENRHITEFYLWLSFGGAIGGIFVTLVAPVVFNSNYEYPILIIVALLTRYRNATNYSKFTFSKLARISIVILIPYTFLIWLSSPFSESPLSLMLIFGIPALILFSCKNEPLPFALGAILIFINLVVYHLNPKEKVLLSVRNFFGTKQVVKDESKNLIYLRHGTINHGSQSLNDENRLEPLSYFHRNGPVGDVFRLFNRDSNSKIAIIGLGIGAMACYSLPKQEFSLYEIDPLVVEIAKNNNYFSYLSDCPGSYKIYTGDGRLELKNAPNNHFSLIFLDAFTSDAVPVHLLTKEAISLYLSKLAPEGIIIFNISNQYLDFRPLLLGASKELGLVMKYRNDQVISEDDYSKGKLASVFAILARNEDNLLPLNSIQSWQSYHGTEIKPWSDHYSNIISLIR